MRFLFLTTHYYPVVFGAELFAQKLAESLVTAGHEVHVVTGEWDDAWELHETVNQVTVHRVRSPHIRYLQTLLYIKPQLVFAKYLSQEIEFDFVHAHIYPSLFNGWKLRTTNHEPRTVVTIQGGDLGDYPEIYGPFGQVAELLIGSSLKRYDTLHAVSTDLANHIKNLSGRDAVVIPNGVDVQDIIKSLPRTTNYVPRTRYVACSPSRLTDKNNLAATILAIKRLRDAHLDVGLVVAGSGHLLDQLRELVCQLKLSEYVFLPGALTHKNTLALMRQADVIVRPSKQEGFGIALLEGMGLGVPVVATTNGGLKDFVSDKTAFVSGTDTDSIASAMKSALIDSVLKKQKVAAARALAHNYTWDRITTRCRKELYGIE